MAIGIDGYNAVFRNFAQFAQRCSDGGISKAVITAEEGRPLNGRRVVSISNTLMDSVYVMRRGAEQKTANDFTRALFRDAVIDIFGGEAKIPKSVKKAMLLADYDKGKPLTARRIMAVKAEIDKVTAKMRAAVATVNATVDEAFDEHSVQIVEDEAQSNGATRLTRRQLHDLAAVAVTRAAHDPDALDVVAKSICFLVRGGDSRFRSAEAVRAKVDAIMDNMEELRAAAKGNKALVAAGKAMIVHLNGGAVARGLLTRMVKAAEKMKSDAIRKLSASSTALQFHTAVAQLRDNLNGAMNKSGVCKELLGGDEMDAARDFFAYAIFSKCSRSTLDKMRGAFGTETASKMMRLYDRVYTRKVGPPPGTSPGLMAYTADQGDVAKKTMVLFKSTVDLLCGVPPEDFQPVEEFQGELDYVELDAYDIMQDLLKAGREAKRTAYELFFSGIVGGNGQGADVMRDIYSRKIGQDAYNINTNINGDLASSAVTMLGWNIMSHCRTVATGRIEDTQFFKDLGRNLNVNLPGGNKLSNDYNVLCDQLASFLTKGAKTSFAALDDKEKAKVHVVMSLLSQETMKAAFDGAAIALHPDKAREAFMTVNNDINNQGSMEFTLSMDDSGAIKMTCFCRKDVAMIMSFGENGAVKNTRVGAGSKMEAQVELLLRSAEMDRLAELDFSKFDENEAKQLFVGTSNNKLETIYNGFPRDFRLNYDNIACSSHFKATLN